MLVAVPLSRDGVPWGSEGCRPRERRRTSLAPLDALVRTAEAPRLVQYGWRELMLPLGASLTIEGPPGSWKSTAASAIALCLAVQHGVQVLYLSAEEGAEDTALARFRRVAEMLGVSIPGNIALSDAVDIHEADADLQAFEDRLGRQRGLVVVDSITQLRPSITWTHDLFKSGHSVVVIQHVTTSGAARGGLEPAFSATTCVTVDDRGRAVVMKNRWGPSGKDCSFNARIPPQITRSAPPEIIAFPRRSS